jgi:hypothetical protein
MFKKSEMSVSMIKKELNPDDKNTLQKNNLSQLETGPVSMKIISAEDLFPQHLFIQDPEGFFMLAFEEDYFNPYLVSDKQGQTHSQVTPTTRFYKDCISEKTLCIEMHHKRSSSLSVLWQKNEYASVKKIDELYT